MKRWLSSGVRSVALLFRAGLLTSHTLFSHQSQHSSTSTAPCCLPCLLAEPESECVSLLFLVIAGYPFEPSPSPAVRDGMGAEEYYK